MLTIQTVLQSKTNKIIEETKGKSGTGGDRGETGGRQGGDRKETERRQKGDRKETERRQKGDTVGAKSTLRVISVT